MFFFFHTPNDIKQSWNADIILDSGTIDYKVKGFL